MNSFLLSTSFVEVNKIIIKDGVGTTLAIFFATLFFAVPLGLPIAKGLMAKTKPIKYVTEVFVWIIRGTPLMLQIFIAWFGPKFLLNWPTRNRLLAVIVAFVINYAAYFAVIYKGGIDGIAIGQREAAQVLGMTKNEAFFKVILKQVIKRILDPMSNETITLVKDTALASSVAVIEITYSAYIIVGRTAAIWPLFYVGIFYLVINGVLTVLFKKAEKKLGYYN